MLQSFQTALPGQPARYGLDGWRAALAEPALRSSLWNTLTVTFVRQLLSLPLAVLVAWLLARTDLPGRRGIEFAFWAAFFLPPLTVTLSWISLLDPEYGLINTSLAALPFFAKGPFNIYSFWGIVWVHVITGSLTVKVILLTPAFRNMNASFEEASRVAGASTLRTALRITTTVAGCIWNAAAQDPDRRTGGRPQRVRRGLEYCREARAAGVSRGRQVHQGLCL